MKSENNIQVALISLARRGGMVHYHADLVNALEITEGVNVTAIKARVVSDEYYTLVSNWYPVETGDGAFGTAFNLFNPLVIWQFIQFVRKAKIDLFHITAPHEWNPVLGLIIRKLLKKPLLFTVHDLNYHEGTPLYFKLPDILFRKMADGFIVHSESWKTSMDSGGTPSERICVVPLGVFSHITQWKNSDIEEENLILFFGRVEPYKGLEILLKASKDIFFELTDWKMIIAGGGDFRPYEDLVNDERIEVLNHYIDDEEVANLFHRAKIVVLPYLSATQSGVIPIAFAFGKAVITTNVGELSSNLNGGELGLLIQPDNVNELVNGVMALAKDERLRQQFGRGAYASILHNSSWETISEIHLDFYKNIMAEFNSTGFD